MEWEIIVKLGAEGGHVTLYGARLEDGAWLFSKSQNENTLRDILSAEEQKSLQTWFEQQSNIVLGWEHGVSLLPSAWPLLYPLEVHPEFREQIWHLAAERAGRYRLGDWAEICFPNPTERHARMAEKRQTNHPFKI